MPIYEFECPGGTVTAKLVKVGTEELNVHCVIGRPKKIISPCTYELKGSGWYADGYSPNNKKG